MASGSVNIVTVSSSDPWVTVCSQGRGAQMGICNGVQSSGYLGNIRKKYIWDVLTPASLSWGMGCHGAGPLGVVLHSNSFAIQNNLLLFT